MKKSVKISIVAFVYVASLILSVFIAAPTYGCACGMLIPSKSETIAMKGETGLVVFDSSTQNEQMAINFQLSGTSSSSALVVPTPVKSEISQIKTIVFSDLYDIVKPKVDSNSDSKVTMGAVPNVQVLERKIVGNFEIAVLKTNSYEDLNIWTADNGFYLESEAKGPVTTYIDKGFVLNVIKLKKDAVDSDINPLLFTFSTSRYFYPLMEIKDSRDALKDKTLSLFLVLNEKFVSPDTEFYAMVENREVSKSTLENDITHTDEKDFSNLKFTSDKYYATYLTRNDYSVDAPLMAVLGNNDSAKAFTAHEVETVKEDSPALSVWSYIFIGIIVIGTAGLITYFFIERNKILKKVLPVEPVATSNTPEEPSEQIQDKPENDDENWDNRTE